MAMDVFVIPLGADRYELYCESGAGDDSDSASEPPAAGLIGRWRQRISEMLKAVEHRHLHREEPRRPQGWVGRLQDRGLAWAAERMAEQRLLWNLRGQTDAVLAHPQDMPFDEVLALVRRKLQEDHDRHRRWLIIDGILFVLTFVALGPLFLLIPGIANLPALYFGFRAVGHWYSMHGARQALTNVTFTSRPCPPLTELRNLQELTPPDRAARIHDIADRLRLPHLATFFERLAV
jgi:hypothetical protein